MITFKINDRPISIEKPMTVLAVAREHGITIPHFCDHEWLKPFGGCRMCFVEVKGMKKLQASCTLMPTEGMEVLTDTPEVVKARKSIMELLLINHPLDCPTCDKAGECDLQDLSVKYGAGAGRFEETKRREPEATSDPLIVRNMERCIMCTRCVRLCEGLQGASAISAVGRGKNTFIEPFDKTRFNCEYCGNCITVCPVGALMSKIHRHNYRPWETDRTVETICPSCGVGCTLFVQVRGQSIQRAIPMVGKGVSKGLLCVRGYFGYEFVGSPRRLTSPLVRKNGKLNPVSWDEALAAVAEGLAKVRDAHGGGAVAAIASDRCTNEANYLLQKLMRAGLGSNNIDSPARLGFAGARRAFEELLGPGCTANVMDGIVNSGAVLVSGGDPTTVNPVLGVRVRGAHMAGSMVITLGHMPGLARHRTIGLAPHPRNEDTALTAILAGLAEAGLPDERPELNALIRDLTASAPAPDEETVRAIKALRAARNVSVVYCPNPIIGGDFHRRVLAVAGIVHALDARLYLLSEGMNMNGLMDAGCLPDELPGGVRLDDVKRKAKMEDAWGSHIPTEPGLSLMKAFEAARDGRVKAMYVLGENPSAKLPNAAMVQDALKGLEFLVVQDIFLSETAEQAHVVLPALGWAEKDGTVTNTERRIQRQRTAVAGPGRADWEILASVGGHMGIHGAYASASDVFDEMAAVSPLYKGLSYNGIDRDSELWPHHAKEVALRGSEIYGSDSGAVAPLSTAPPHPLLLPMRALINEGSVSRSSEALRSICPPDALHIHEATAEGLSLADGDTVELATASGNMVIKILIDNQIPENVLLVTNMLGGSGLMGLLRYTIDPGTKTPVISDEHAVLKKVN